MTSIASAGLGEHHDGSSTWVRLDEPQRARCGRSRAVAPPSRRTARSRPYPHRFSRPAGRPGRPASRPPGPRTRRRHRRTAARKAFQVTTATMPRPGPRPPGAARVAACPLRPRPEPRTPHPPGNDIMTTTRPRPWSRDQHRAARCSPCRRARKRAPAASPGPACSRRTTPTLLCVLKKNGAEHGPCCARGDGSHRDRGLDHQAAY